MCWVAGYWTDKPLWCLESCYFRWFGSCLKTIWNLSWTCREWFDTVVEFVLKDFELPLTCLWMSADWFLSVIWIYFWMTCYLIYLNCSQWVETSHGPDSTFRNLKFCHGLSLPLRLYLDWESDCPLWSVCRLVSWLSSTLISASVSGRPCSTPGCWVKLPGSPIWIPPRGNYRSSMLDANLRLVTKHFLYGFHLIWELTQWLTLGMLKDLDFLGLYLILLVAKDGKLGKLTIKSP